MLFKKFENGEQSTTEVEVKAWKTRKGRKREREKWRRNNKKKEWNIKTISFLSIFRWIISNNYICYVKLCTGILYCVCEYFVMNMNNTQQQQQWILNRGRKQQWKTTICRYISTNFIIIINVYSPILLQSTVYRALNIKKQKTHISQPYKQATTIHPSTQPPLDMWKTLLLLLLILKCLPNVYFVVQCVCEWLSSSVPSSSTSTSTSTWTST